jgi:hypothetical protein
MDYPFRAVVRGYLKFLKHLQEGCPMNRERGNLFATPLKKLKVKLKIHEATYSFNTKKRFIF